MTSVVPVCNLHDLSEGCPSAHLYIEHLKNTSELPLIGLWLTSAWPLFYLCAACTTSLRSPLGDLNIYTLKCTSDMPIYCPLIDLCMTSVLPVCSLHYLSEVSFRWPWHSYSKVHMPIIGRWLTSAWPLFYLCVACMTSLSCPRCPSCPGRRRRRTCRASTTGSRGT